MLHKCCQTSLLNVGYGFDYDCVVDLDYVLSGPANNCDYDLRSDVLGIVGYHCADDDHADGCATCYDNERGVTWSADHPIGFFHVKTHVRPTAKQNFQQLPN